MADALENGFDADTERARLVSGVMRDVLPRDVPAALDVIVRSFGAPLCARSRSRQP